MECSLIKIPKLEARNVVELECRGRRGDNWKSDGEYYRIMNPKNPLELSDGIHEKQIYHQAYYQVKCIKENLLP